MNCKLYRIKNQIEAAVVIKFDQVGFGCMKQYITLNLFPFQSLVDQAWTLRDPSNDRLRRRHLVVGIPLLLLWPMTATG